MLGLLCSNSQAPFSGCSSSTLLASAFLHLKIYMANSCGFRPAATLQTILVLISATAVPLADAGGQGQCPPFSCGDLHNISYPFRRPGDPPECGVPAYKLDCSSSKPRIHINTGTYFVTDINYTDSSFWVVDANLDMHSSCHLPRWDQLPYDQSGSVSGICPQARSYLATAADYWACFVNCSQAVTNFSWYKSVPCLTTNSSFVYVSVFGCSVDSLKPSCGYLTKIPFDGHGSSDLPPQNVTYANIIESATKGFRVNFPSDVYCPQAHAYVNLTWKLRTCLIDTNRFFHAKISGTSPWNWTIAFFWSEIYFAQRFYGFYYNETTNKLFLGIEVILYAIGVTKLLIVLCRLVFPPLVIYTFLARKYWKTKIAIDAVEKFLRMQQMLGPTRFAYTDITAITSHFRDKLGQGGYGCVYKGVLLPGDVHLAVKILSNSNCNGDEFISEVSTIGRIHHINVVRLVGFCAEDMRRALVYEYMPHGSLDKYIFSSERSFSWDKLNEIALGIARGINYLHRGCDMQILHFDIKPHNILLDINFVPKVADFGLAKLYPRDNSFVPMSASRGTIGYIAPEMYCRGFGAVSSKSDVYSFGMLLLEMAGGRRNFYQNAESPSQKYYPSWVYCQLAKHEAGEISSASIVHMHELERKLCVIGLRCIQLNPQDRPTMSEVIEILESSVGGLQMPSTRPFFCGDDDTDDRIAVSDSRHSSSELTAILEEDE